jgi:hypothetical protein
LLDVAGVRRYEIRTLEDVLDQFPLDPFGQKHFGAMNRHDKWVKVSQGTEQSPRSSVVRVQDVRLPLPNQLPEPHHTAQREFVGVKEVNFVL